MSFFKNKVVWDIASMIIGFLMMITGLIFGLTPAESYYTSSAKDVTFGADYYTEEYNATRIAASNAAVTANNIRELGSKHATYFGYFVSMSGFLILFTNARKMFTEDLGQKK